MGQEKFGDRLFPAMEDDEVESPPFPFARFEELMAASYLNNIRDPNETRYPVGYWFDRFAPDWRWARAHSLLEVGRGSGSDEDTYAAFDLLGRRVRGLVPYGARHMIDAVLIFERNDRTRWLLESHLLLPEPPTNLATKLGLAPMTVRYYESWFFDVRRWLSKSSWISARVLGGSPWLGFTDDDLAPVWRRVAYFSKNERMLDLAVAVTTGTGEEQFSGEECEAMQLRIEEMRLSPIFQAKQVIQLHRRMEAERIGLHPSVYHIPRQRRSRKVDPVRTKGLSCSEAAN